MEDFNFDTVQERKNTNSIKYDFAVARGKREGLLPLWVADMDFQTPPEVREALVKCAEHGIFGYSEPQAGYYEAVCAWFSKYFGYDTKPEWIVKTPGVVFAIAVAVRAFAEKGDAVMIQRPVYYPFSAVILENKCKLVNNPLVYQDGKYGIDFEDFERKMVENRVKLFILCNPHNPVGRVWTREELERIGDICLKHGCLVLSDEIHCDFVYAPRKHTVFATIKPEFGENSIICTAPSKTFNLAGLQVSNVFIQNAKLRKRFETESIKTGYSQLNTMGIAACEAAYRHGSGWLHRLKEYLSENIKLVGEFAERNGIKLIPTEGTYLVWLDFSPLGFSDDELDHLIENKAGLWLDDGRMFGKEGSGFQRINVACPRSILADALSRLEKAITGK
ncbi:MAG: pyridoxal phosphate-dependent aminotransferase [Fibrobacter sp.]|jgi:cystathionine beta-lyase|nr:pyridoxal phosphate-dependent aminotransferase [Fibrobacter sp.]